MTVSYAIRYRERSMQDKLLTVSEVARLTGVTVRTLHHYDEIGLLVCSRRAPNGYRLYSDEDIGRLHQILLLRERGFALEAIHKQINDPSFDRLAALREQRDALRTQLRQLRSTLRGVEAALAVLEMKRAVDFEAMFNGGKTMLTELQKKKLAKAFSAWDTDGNGLVEESDFDTIVNNLLKIRAIEKGSKEHSTLRDHFAAQWQLLKPRIGDPARKGVTLAEWHAFYEEVLTAVSYKQLTDGLVSFLWQLLDVDNDGKVSKQEFTQLLAAYRLPAENADDLWRRFGKSPDGGFSRDELFTIVDQFYFSEDPQAPGGFFFGPF